MSNERARSCARGVELSVPRQVQIIIQNTLRGALGRCYASAHLRVRVEKYMSRAPHDDSYIIPRGEAETYFR